MSTQDNLKEAFAGESQANRKYLAFSQKAQGEGFEKVGRLFQVVAEAETIHALKHLGVMKGVSSTLDNLKEAVAGEHHEFTEMYPGFIAEAEKEGNQQAKTSFHLANEVEKVHHKLYEKALQAVEQQQDIQTEAFYLCPVCGHVEENEAPGRCPVCGAPGAVFKKY
ncbi:MAG: rubrerythrin [Firmicutes bacterium HGW-Firmicutes-15]|nr:MAG: rubrerythrin [Firmicutes bacterium HGW-Firmicutes-15]